MPSINPPDESTMGGRVAYLREKRQWSQHQLAEAAGIKQPSLWSIEKNKTKDITAKTLFALCSALHTRWEYLWYGPTAIEGMQEDEAALLATFRSIPVDKRQSLIDFAHHLRGTPLSVVSRNDDHLQRRDRNPGYSQKESKHPNMEAAEIPQEFTGNEGQTTSGTALGKGRRRP